MRDDPEPVTTTVLEIDTRELLIQWQGRGQLAFDVAQSGKKQGSQVPTLRSDVDDRTSGKRLPRNSSSWPLETPNTNYVSLH